MTVDRPLGSAHPKYSYAYPVNYGYVPNTKAPDGAELDAYILGVDTPLQTFTGKCIAILHRLDDDDDKLIVCDPEQPCSDKEIIAATHFQERWFTSEIVRNMPAPQAGTSE